MKKWLVWGKVHATKFLGEVEAETEDEAIEKASAENGHVSVCHQCCGEVSDPEIEDFIVEAVE